MSQIKSKERVRDLAEVYTNEREVNAMLDLIPFDDPNDIIGFKYLEPACGNGNFLIEILRRKLKRVNIKYQEHRLIIYQFYLARCLSGIYGIDICPDNVLEARARLFGEVKSCFDTHKGSFLYSEGFLPLIQYILDHNIVVGDSINKPGNIELVEYKLDGRQMIRRFFNYADLTQAKPQPVRVLPAKHFLHIGLEYQMSTGAMYEGKQRHLELV